MKDLLKKEFDVIPIVSARIRHIIDDPGTLEELITKEVIIQTPAGTDDDLFILETALIFQAFVLSNDLFRQYKTRYANVIRKRMPFILLRNHFILPQLSN